MTNFASALRPVLVALGTFRNKRIELPLNSAVQNCWIDFNPQRFPDVEISVADVVR